MEKGSNRRLDPIGSFRERGYIGWNSDLSTLHSKISATVESREVTIVVIEEMNAFLEEMKAFLEEMKIAEAEENRRNENS